MFKNNLGIIFKRGLCIILTIMLVFNNSTSYVIGKNIDQSGFSNYIDDIKTGNIRGHELLFVTPNELYDQDQDGIMDAKYIELLLADIDWYSADWDKDGIKNKDEISIKKDKQGYYYDIISNPFYDNTDFDIFLDGQEKKSNASPVRYSFQIEDYNNLFMNNITDNVIKNLALDLNLKYADITFGEKEIDVYKNAILTFIINGLDENDLAQEDAVKIDSEYGDYYNEYIDKTLGFLDIYGNDKIQMGIQLIDFIKQIYSEALILDYKEKIKDYTDLLTYMEKDKFFNKGKKAVKDIKIMIKDDLESTINMSNKFYADLLSDIAIDKLTDIVPHLKKAKLFYDIGMFIVKLTNIDEKYKSSLECITYATIVRAIGEKIKTKCEKSKVKVPNGQMIFGITTYDTVEVVTIKKGEVAHVISLFKDYIRAVSLLLDKYDEISSINKITGINYYGVNKDEIISNLNIIEKRISMSLFYEKEYWDKIGLKKIDNAYNTIDKRNVGKDGWNGDYYYENGKMKTNSWVEYDGNWYYLGSNGKYLRNEWLELSGDYYYFGINGEMFKDTTTPDGSYVGSDGKYIKQNSIDQLLELYKEKNMYSYMFGKQAKFDQYGNLWYEYQQEEGGGVIKINLVIKYLNGSDSKVYQSYFSDRGYIGHSNIYSYIDNESENMFKMYKAMADNYDKFKK